MVRTIRLVGALVVSTALAYGTALACEGVISCSKSADVREISEYPATINYRVNFSYSFPNNRCAVGWLNDTLLPSGYFTFPAIGTVPYEDLFWVNNPTTGSEYKTYQVVVSSYNDCKALALPALPAADGSVTLKNVVDGGDYFGEFAFTCQTNVICRPPPVGHGCTLTPGYWKTHSNFGPAPYDNTWANIPGGASAIFFTSGKSYFEVLWTDSSGGNAYYILARAYIAAVLNGFAGASEPDEVDAAIDWAASFFATHGPTTVLSKALRAQAIAYAGVLDNYNNGYIGPGHCAQ